MTTPTTSIDALPVKTGPVGTELLIVQDAGVTKKMAINEMVSLPSPALTAHLSDTDDAHDASAISAVDAGNGINGANVQAQLGQLSTSAAASTAAAAAADAKIVAHLAAALDAHDASAISAIAGVILTGTDVQAQLTQIEAALAGGTVGPEGPPGDPGPGVPIGGAAGDVLSKINADDYSTQWLAPLWLPLTGGRVQGVTQLIAPVEALQIGRSGGDGPHLGFYDPTFATRYGFLQALAADMRFNHATGPIKFLPGNVLKWTMETDGDFFGPGIIRPSGGLRTGAPVRAPSSLMQVYGTGTAAAPNAFLSLYGQATDLDTIGPRTGYIGNPSSAYLYIINEIDNGWIRLQSDLGTLNYAGGVEQNRTVANGSLFGKTAYNTWATVSGAEIWTDEGQLFLTQSKSTFNAITHIGAADGNGIGFLRFYRTGSTIMGSINQVNLSAVVYNTTSDSRLKTFTRDVDDEEALQKIRDMRPLHFTWNHDPDAGEQIGFFAQELYEIAPEAATPGSGEPGDEMNEDGSGGFVPWGTDVGKLVPRLVAAMQAMDHKIVAMRTEITSLQAEVTELRHGRKK